MHSQRLFIIMILLFMASCSRQPDEPSIELARSDIVPAAAPDTAERVKRVEDGLVKMFATGRPDWENTMSLAERLAHYQVPGLSIAVIEDYEIDWARGYGTLEAGRSQPVITNTLFHAGSIAKTLSAAAALTLVEKGLLDLDENVNDRLVSWQVPENAYSAEAKVTLRRLLSHSAGLEDGFTNRSSDDPMPDYITGEGEAPQVTLVELLNAEPGIDVDGPTLVSMVPGSEYRYANADYAILELLVEDVIETPFADFMAETVLEPLGMTSSTFEQPLPEEFRKRAATEHDVNGQPFEGKRGHFPLIAGGGLWTTPSDLARFAIEMMLAFNGRSEEILSEEMAQEMLSSQIAIEEQPLFDANGLGFHLSGEVQTLYVGHTGGTWGSTAIIWFYPETGQGAVIMSNSATGSNLLIEVLLSIAAEYGWPGIGEG